MYLKQFEIRWSDIDANSHLANSAYTNFFSHTRMAFFTDYGLDLAKIQEYGLGPVVFFEHTYYFKEIHLGAKIKVGLEFQGMSEDGTFFQIEHNLYDEKGKNLARSEMMGGWIDLENRSLTALPAEILKLSETFPKSKEFKILTKEDTRKHGRRPMDLG